MNNERYNSFIFNMQFKRKASPQLFFLSLKGMRIIVGFLLVYYLASGKTLIFLLVLLFIYSVKEYAATRLNYASKLTRYNQIDPHISIPLLSFVATQREKRTRVIGELRAAMATFRRADKKPKKKTKGETNED